MFNLIDLVYAQTKAPGGTPQGRGPNFLILMLATIAIFYFFMIRPQQKKEKQRKKLISELKPGDKVLTVGGMYGVVDSIKENDILVVKVDKNTKIEFARSAINTKVVNN